MISEIPHPPVRSSPFPEIAPPPNITEQPHPEVVKAILHNSRCGSEWVPEILKYLVSRGCPIPEERIEAFEKGVSLSNDDSPPF